MTNQAYPSLNDVEPSWADIEVSATVTGGALIEMIDIAAIKWSRSVEVGEKRGASGGRVMSRTRGSVSYEASMTLYRAGLKRLKRGLMENAEERGNQKLISLVGFDIMVQHTPPGTDEIFQTKIKGCRYLGDSEDNGEGSDADQVEVTLSVIEIADIIDGKEVVLI
jgi:hypothetical protein